MEKKNDNTQLSDESKKEFSALWLNKTSENDEFQFGSVSDTQSTQQQTGNSSVEGAKKTKQPRQYDPNSFQRAYNMRTYSALYEDEDGKLYYHLKDGRKMEISKDPMRKLQIEDMKTYFPEGIIHENNALCGFCDFNRYIAGAMSETSYTISTDILNTISMILRNRFDRYDNAFTLQGFQFFTMMVETRLNAVRGYLSSVFGSIDEKTAEEQVKAYLGDEIRAINAMINRGKLEEAKLTMDCFNDSIYETITLNLLLTIPKREELAKYYTSELNKALSRYTAYLNRPPQVPIANVNRF